MRFTLRRTRPPGHVGSKRTWLAADHWSLVVEVAGRSCDERTRGRLDRKARELRAEYRRHTPEGREEFTERWMRHHLATKDEAFQVFKAKIPGLASPRRQRRSRPCRV